MLPVHAGTPYLPWHDPCEATRLLRYALPRQGLSHTYQSNGSGMSVLSVLTEVTVWSKDGSFIWNEEGATVSHPIDDPLGAAQRIADHYRHPESSQEGRSPMNSVCEQST